MRVGDILAWLLIFVLAVTLFLVLPMLGLKSGQLDGRGVKLVIIGIPVMAKLIHSLWSDERPKPK